nr:silicatein alpha 3 [Lubomirskia baikalensis]
MLNVFIALGFLCLVELTYAAPDRYENLQEWSVWKGHHQRSYESQLQEMERHSIWVANKKYIEHHNANADLFGYTLAMNGFGDLMSAEFTERYLTHKHSQRSGLQTFESPKGVTYADSLDWRTRGVVTSVQSQGQCGSSYAFAAAGALEGATALAADKLVALSEQNIIDCSVPYGNHGCSGGDVYTAFKYVVDNGGIDTESSYPYKGKKSSCQYNSKNVGAISTGVVKIASGSETDLLSAVASVGPIAVAVDASVNAFMFYQSGVFDSSTCSTSKLNHAMLVTGYGSTNGKDYWLVKNSWGTGWGESGYIKMVRNKYNQCGIASDALYPML